MTTFYTHGNLTGRYRFREQKRWGRKSMLVLQVEIAAEAHSYPDMIRDVIRWRDGTTEDLLGLGITGDATAESRA